MKIDLTTVDDLLDDCLKTIGLLHGRDLTDAPELQNDTGPADRAARRREVAECSRQLTRLADNLALASALTRHEYHVAVKGAPDPVFNREEGP